MHFLVKAFRAGRTLLLASTVLAGTAIHGWSQEATLVLAPNEVGLASYDPVRATALSTPTALIYDRLIVQDTDFSYHPYLAESWEEAPDGLTWTFHLKKGVNFHNGKPFNAQTIADWIPLFKGTEDEFMVAAIKTVEVVDEHTVRFVMGRPEPNMLFNLASYFMSIPEPGAFKELDKDFGVTQAIGTGPYKLESFTIGQETVLVRNDEYSWGPSIARNKGPAKIEKLTFREIPEASTAFLELKTGGVDMLLGVPTDFLDQLKAEPQIGVVTLPGLDVAYMPINTSKEPLTDIKVREGIAFAINQKQIFDSIYKGVGKEAHNFLIDALPELKVDPQYLISYDPARSAAAFDAAGWKLGPDGIRVKDGKPLAFKLWSQSDTEFKRMTEAIQAQLKAVGVQAEIGTFDSSAIRDLYKKNEHELSVRSYSWGNADILDWFFSGERLGYPNVSMWKDAKSDELDKRALSESTTSEERIANFKAYHEYLLSNFVFAPIYQPAQNIGYNKERLKLPATIPGPQYDTAAILDTEVAE